MRPDLPAKHVVSKINRSSPEPSQRKAASNAAAGAHEIQQEKPWRGCRSKRFAQREAGGDKP